MHEELLVVAKPVQLVQDGKVFRLVGIERSGKHDAIRYAAGKNFTGDSVALHAAGSKRRRGVKEIEAKKEVKERVAERSGERRVTSGERRMATRRHDALRSFGHPGDALRMTP